MKVKLLSAAILTFTAFSLGTAQRPAPSPKDPSQDDVVRITTKLVQADVVVSDKSGRQVTDLKPEDFEILEDGKRQTVTHFSYVSSEPGTTSEGQAAAGETKPPATESSATAVTPVPLSPEQTRRTFAIVVDDLGLSAESIVSVRKALNQFVNQQMQPNDLVAIIRTTQGSGTLQQFTSDKRRLLAAIENIRWFAAGRGGLSAFAPVNTQTEVTSVQSAQIIDELEEERASKYAVGTIGALGFVVNGLRELPGRKAVLLIAESFRLFTAQGRNVRLIESLKRVTDQANLSSTVIYTVDASGLNPLNLTAEDKVAGLSYSFDPNAFSTTPSPPLRNRGSPRRNDVPTAASIALEEGGSSAAFKRLDALVAQRDNQNVQTHSVLSFLSEETGGLFTSNTNNLSIATERMLQDQRGYYLLAYRPSDSGDAATGRHGYHKISVKVKRSGLQVRSRAGYYAGSNEVAGTKNKTSAQRLAAAVVSPFSAAAVGLRVTPLFFNDSAQGSYLRVLLHVDAADLTFSEQSDKSQKTILDVAAVNFGDGGKVIDQFTDTQTIEVGQEHYEGIRKNGVSFVLNVPVKKAGAYQLRVAVRDVTSDQIGSAGQFIQVPDLSSKDLSVSGIVISGINQPAAAAPKGADGAASQASNKPPAPDDATLQAAPAIRRLAQGMILSYSYVIYNVAVKENRPQLETQMFLLRDGAQVFAGKLSSFDPGSQTDMKRLKVNGGLRIGPELTPGEYVLQVVITDKLRDRPNTAVQSLDFSIR